MKKMLRFLPFLVGVLATSAQAQNTPQLATQTRLIVRLQDDQQPALPGEPQLKKKWADLRALCAN